MPDDELICRLVSDKGLAWLLRGDDAPLPSPIEQLTDHYATSHERLAWERRLVPMSALGALGAVQTDMKAPTEMVTAALTLLPTLHAELETAAAALQARVPGSEPAA
jgi:hypothetical protein